MGKPILAMERRLFAPFKLAWITTTIRKVFVIYVSDLSYFAGQYLDRYLVTLFLGLQLAGVYFLYWSAASAVTTFVSIAVLQIQRPRLIKAYHDGGALAHRQLTDKFMNHDIGYRRVQYCRRMRLLHRAAAAKAAYFHSGSRSVVLADHGMAVRNVADFGAMALFTSHRDRMTLTNLTLAQILLLPFTVLYGAGAAILFTFSAMTLWRYKLVFSPVSDGRQSNPSP